MVRRVSKVSPVEGMEPLGVAILVTHVASRAQGVNSHGDGALSPWGSLSSCLVDFEPCCGSFKAESKVEWGVQNG